MNTNTDKDDTCLGCKENQANQAAHMDFGGCLYVDLDMYIDNDN